MAEHKKIKQQIYNYTAIFNPAEEGGFNVSFPSLPGCVTFGRSFEEAQAMAEEVLELWLGVMRDRKEEIPLEKPRPIIGEVQISLPAR